MKGKVKGIMKSEKTNIICLECDYKFKKKIDKYTCEIECPRCNSIDIEIDINYVLSIHNI